MKRFLSWVLSACLLLMPHSGALAMEVKYTQVFDPSSVMEIDFEVEESLWQQMLDHAMTKEVICCNVTVNGEKYYSVGVNCKGNSSLAQTENDRYSLRVTFDEYVHQQSLKGLDKILLNNMYADATYMKEFLSYELFGAMGVPTPLHAFAHVTVNGEEYGFMLALEAVEDDYEARNFGTEEGQLYKVETMDMNGMGLRSRIIPQERQRRGAGEGFWNDFSDRTRPTVPSVTATPGAGQTDGAGAETAAPDREALPAEGEGPTGPGNGPQGFFGEPHGADLKYTDDRIESYSAIFNGAEDVYTGADASRVIHALKVLAEGSDEEVAAVFDVDELLRYFAVNTLLVNTDHYTGVTLHNYYLYEYRGVLSMLPWDYNLSFGGFLSGDTSRFVNFPIDTPVDGADLSQRPLLARLLGNSGWLERYHGYLAEALAWFDDFEERVQRIGEMIAPFVRGETNPFFTWEEHLASVPALVRCVRLRAESVRAQLEGRIPSDLQGQKADPGALIGIGTADLSLTGMQTENGKGTPLPPDPGAGEAHMPLGMDGQTPPAEREDREGRDAYPEKGAGKTALGQGPGILILLAALAAMLLMGLLLYKRK